MKCGKALPALSLQQLIRLSGSCDDFIHVPRQRRTIYYPNRSVGVAGHHFIVDLFGSSPSIDGCICVEIDGIVDGCGSIVGVAIALDKYQAFPKFLFV